MEKIKTNETITEMFFRLKEECELPIAKLYYIEKLYKILPEKYNIPETHLYGILPDGNKIIEYPSLNAQNVSFYEPEKFIGILEEITNKNNFLCWCNYKDYSVWRNDNNLKFDMSSFLSWVDVDMNLEALRR
jgi:hypothetical protein